MSGRLAGAALPDKLMAPHRQLHEEDLGNRIVVPAAKKQKSEELFPKPDMQDKADGGLWIK